MRRRRRCEDFCFVISFCCFVFTKCARDKLQNARREHLSMVGGEKEGPHIEFVKPNLVNMKQQVAELPYLG